MQTAQKQLDTGVYLIMHKYGDDDYSLWATATPQDTDSGLSWRGTLIDLEFDSAFLEVYELADKLEEK